MAIERPPDDPVFLHSRREALVILLVWAASFAWTVPYCYLYGYEAPANPAQLETVLGMPAWVMWGVAVPWVVFGVIAILLCTFFIRDDDLGTAPDETDLKEEKNGPLISADER